MAHKAHMSAIRKALRKRLEQLGYECSVSHQCLISFTCNGTGSNSRGNFEIESANAKRLEIYVYGEKKELIGQCRQAKSRWVATQRFPKSDTPQNINDILTFIGECKFSHSHLGDRLDPTKCLPEPIHFTNANFIMDEANSFKHGIIDTVHAISIAVNNGFQVVMEELHDPKKKAFVLVQIKSNYNTYFAITDGDGVHAVVHANGAYMVCNDIRNPIVKDLMKLNKSDHALIKVAVNHLFNELAIDKVDDDETE